MPLSKAAEAEGAKAKLFSILGAAAEPLTAGAPACRTTELAHQLEQLPGLLPAAHAGGGGCRALSRQLRQPLPSRWPAGSAAVLHVPACPAAAPAAQVWEAAQPLGFKSKRFTKQMLQQMRAGGWVKTKPLQGAAAGSGKRKSGFGYQVVQAKQQRRAAQPAAAGGGGAAA